MTTALGTPAPPSGPRPPDSRMRWHVLSGVIGTILAIITIWAASALENTALAIGFSALALLLWGLISSQSSLGYLAPTLILGCAAFVQHNLVDLPLLGEYLWTPTSGLVTAGAAGLTLAVHQARRDGRDIVRHDETAAAIHSAHAPKSRLRQHVVTGIIAVLLAATAFGGSTFGGENLFDYPGNLIVYPWDVLIASILLAATAALGGFSSFALMLAGVLGSVYAVFHLFGAPAQAHEPPALAVAALLLLTGALACRIARSVGSRVERRERTITGA